MGIGIAARTFLLMTTAMALVATAVYPSAAGDEVGLAETAERFTRFVLLGEPADGVFDYTPDMEAAFPAAKVAQIRTAIQMQHGSVEKIGGAWFEDRVQNFVRYRVPVHFEKSVLDARIVFDNQDRIAGLWFVEHSEPPPREATSSGTEVDVVVGEGDTALPGTLLLPAGEGPFPGVVLVHGSGPNDRDETIGPNKPFRALARGLAERGIASLRYDKRSLVRPGDLTALGESLTVKREVIDDALVALALLRDNSAVDSERVFVVGHSLGGHLAPRIANSDPKTAGVVVLAGSAMPLPEKALQQIEYIASIDGTVTEDEQRNIDEIAKAVATIRAGLNGEAIEPGHYLGAPLPYWVDLESTDTPGLLARLGIPCLVIQGSRDYQVTLDDFALWKQSLEGNPNACLKVFEGLDHLLRRGEGKSSPADYDVYKPVDPAVIECIASWILTGTCCE